MTLLLFFESLTSKIMSVVKQPKKTRGGGICAVVGCSNTYGNSGGKTSFYRFPKREHYLERRNKWIKLVNRMESDKTPWQPTPYSRICSQHFVGNKKSEHPSSPSYNPSIFPSIYRKRRNYKCLSNECENGVEKNRTLQTKPTQIEKVYIQETNFKECNVKESNVRESNVIESNVKDTYVKESNLQGPNMQDPCLTKNSKDVGIQVYHYSKFDDSFTENFICNLYVANEKCHAQTQVYIPVNKCKTYVLTRDFGCETKVKVKDSFCEPMFPGTDKGFHGYMSIENEQQLNSLCGVSQATFDLFMTSLKHQKTNKMSNHDRLLIFLFKMKNNMTFCAIGVLFGIHRSSVSRIFYNVLTQLSHSCRKYIFWPSRQEINESMPPIFKEKYPNCRCIVDFIEIGVEGPPTVDHKEQSCWVYKDTHAVKMLLACTPNGSISFVSKCYSGHERDNFITNQSGFLKILEVGDEILTHKKTDFMEGSGIKSALDSLGKDVLLKFPPMVYNKPFKSCIQRMKMYNIIQKVSVDSISNIDNIVFMSAVLANLQK